MLRLVAKVDEKPRQPQSQTLSSTDGYFVPLEAIEPSKVFMHTLRHRMAGGLQMQILKTSNPFPFIERPN